MNTEERLNELEKKIDSNMENIIANMNRLHSHEQQISNNEQNIKRNTGAIEVLHAIKSYNNRFFFMWLVTFFAFLLSLGYTIYLLNDISSVETTTQQVEQENNNGNNNYIGRDGDING